MGGGQLPKTMFLQGEKRKEVLCSTWSFHVFLLEITLLGRRQLQKDGFPGCLQILTR